MDDWYHVCLFGLGNVSGDVTGLFAILVGIFFSVSNKTKKKQNDIIAYGLIVNVNPSDY